MSPGRQLAVAVVVGAAGGGLALFAASRTWLVAYTQRPVPLPPLGIAESGASLNGLLPALAVVALAAAGGVLATRSWARVVVGAVGALSGAGIVAAAVTTLVDTIGVRVAGPLACVVGGVVVLGAGVLTVVRGRGWPAMGSRYERTPRAVGPDAPASQLWDAIDRGEDPTASADPRAPTASAAPIASAAPTASAAPADPPASADPSAPAPRSGRGGHG